MRKLSCSMMLLVVGLAAGCGGETSAGSQEGGSNLNGGGAAGSGQAGSGQAGSGGGTAGSGVAGSGQAGSGVAGSGVAGSGQAGSGQAGSGQAGSGQAGSGQAGSGGSDCCATVKCGGEHPVCVEGACFDLKAGECFSDADCGKGSTCSGAIVCGCDQPECFAATQPGKCSTDCPDSHTPAQLCVDGKIQAICLGPTEGIPQAIVDCGNGTCVQNGETCPGQSACGGLLGLTCADGQFCSFPLDAKCGAADQQGTCKPLPEVCPEGCSQTLLCGCDGKQYCNECEANAAGTSLIACPTEDKVCGGFKGDTCAADEFCDFPEQAICGFADGTGVCKKKPTECGVGCPAPEFQLCGCDGQKYCNACEANKAGTSVTACPAEQKCGGLLGLTCADGQFCSFPLEAQCGAGDQQGTCKPLPEVCPEGCSQTLLCGCDGKQYCNECDANAAGTSLTECPTEQKVCGGKKGDTCAADEYCDFPDAAICGFADGTGVCKKKPTECGVGCPAPEFQLCGCDGQKYCNACEAAAKGVDTRPCGEKKAGDDCGSSSECGGGLLCCYPCGIQGCTNQCMAPAPDGQCPMFP